MQVFLISPRGFCAGVTRAINIVEGAIEKYGNEKTIFVKHEIVHNDYVVNYFKNKNVKFIEDVSEIKEDGILIFSAHGVSKKIESDAKERNIQTIDATCPLVKKVHRIAQKHESENKKIILIGHEGHPEVEGTMGRVDCEVFLVQNESDIDKLSINKNENVAYITQTTLSIDDTIGIIAKLKEKFPNISSQDNSDICYATQNRQDAVKSIVKNLDLLITLGSKASSNSNRLKDIGLANGIDSYLINDKSELLDAWFDKKKSVGITSGASSPNILLNEIVDYIKTKFNAEILEHKILDETIEFHVPKDIRLKISDLV